MNSETIQPVKHLPYWSFIALLYSLLGWALFETWLLLMGGGTSMHIIAAIPGATLVIRSAIAIGHRSIDPMFLALAAWLLWSCACCALLFRAEQVSRAKRERVVTGETINTQPQPARFPG